MGTIFYIINSVCVSANAFANYKRLLYNVMLGSTYLLKKAKKQCNIKYGIKFLAEIVDVLGINVYTNIMLPAVFSCNTKENKIFKLLCECTGENCLDVKYGS